MRIISGTLGGRRFQGKVPDGIRPTSEMVRESIFNKLMQLTRLEDATLADICSGTGAMGIEALSRGAASCIFVDKSKISCNYLLSALDFFQISRSQYTVARRPAESFPKFFAEKFPGEQLDIVFCDPPYALNILNQLLFDIKSLNLLKDNGIIVVEYSTFGGIVIPDGMTCIDKKIYGDTVVSYLMNLTTSPQS